MRPLVSLTLLALTLLGGVGVPLLLWNLGVFDTKASEDSQTSGLPLLSIIDLEPIQSYSIVGLEDCLTSAKTQISTGWQTGLTNPNITISDVCGGVVTRQQAYTSLLVDANQVAQNVDDCLQSLVFFIVSVAYNSTYSVC